MTERPFHIGIRVYYEDTDASGVVYHANYLRYFERARTEWLESRGHDHATLAGSEAVVFTLSDLSLRFRRPARLDDRLDVFVTVAAFRRARIVFAQEIRRNDTLLIQGEFTVACVNIHDFRPVRLPKRLYEELS
ncbi:tol-pal system-associated acyl-CoA thioesterase [Salinisphaera sp. Q1T1-3]|uniref:tol-pal system-associated acyl-CoA thioesterase n=1 Tax=Salinisphaera sp. Q1T1-3 TaxID=2321229 RepID=UPI000E71AB17|nr:tol-pal system-associated acyl-CoA thioesterase [Salinisphaera sp. Q1T1-3]RJS95263.1 tol-pal system-associated acyl-CoA thioesterase [Salinisphaera sp. Q1T1-3]